MKQNTKTNTKNPPVCLIIIDGLGISKKKDGNAYHLTGDIYLKKITKEYPTAKLLTHGKSVGLPSEVVGSSEVGHTNIGAGRIVEQDLTMINREIKNGNFFENKVLATAYEKAKGKKATLHLMGLLSDGKVHADIGHLTALLKMAKKYNLKKVYLHIFTDGRDMGETESIRLVKKLQNTISALGVGTIATISGRYYAMDRIERWGRIGGVHAAIALGDGDKARDPIEALSNYHSKEIFDSFIPPTVILDSKGQPMTKVHNGDVIVFFNLRSDRARSLTKTFMKPEDFPANGHILKNLHFVALTNFGEDLPVHVAYDNSHITNTLPEALATADHLKQLYIAEEEKFPHITYFLHGLSSLPLRNENKIKVPSKDVSTYDKYPAMSAKEIGIEVMSGLKNQRYDFIGINFANPDMLAHTGDIKATVQGIRIVDQEIKKIAKEILKQEGILFIVSDHGNAEMMTKGRSNTPINYHSKNPVNFTIISNNKKLKLKKRGILGDVAPTILDLMNLSKPKSWRKSLLK